MQSRQLTLAPPAAWQQCRARRLAAPVAVQRPICGEVPRSTERCHDRALRPRPFADSSKAATPAQSLRNTLDLARHAEALGYRRYWLAEHHNMPGIASAATVRRHRPCRRRHLDHPRRRRRHHAAQPCAAGHRRAVRHAGGAVSRAASISASAARRAPTWLTARALRRNLEAGADSFPQDVVELMGYFGPAEPGQRVRAVPGEGEDVPVWILGSSLFGAQLAAMLGLPYAFASHFAPAETGAGARHLPRRASSRPSGSRSRYVMLGLNVFAADTDAEARLLFSSLQQAFVNLRTGRPGRLPPPVEDFESGLDPMATRDARPGAVAAPSSARRRRSGAASRPSSRAHRRRRADGDGADLRPCARRRAPSRSLPTRTGNCRRRHRISTPAVMSADQRTARTSSLSGKQVAARPFLACHSPIERRVLKPGRPSAPPTS